MIYNNDRDSNVKQWETEQHERSLLTSPSYRQWWEQNKERILAEDELRHEMNMKQKVVGNEDDYINQYENE